MKPTEIYAPNYSDGEHVVLIRYPHGGTFEIPELVVNNKNKEAKSILGNAVDAVGINSATAAILSGADFDGDTALVIPVNERVRIKTSPPLEGLKGFDPKEAYPGYEGMKVMSPRTKQIEMGKVSNLITDMTLKGAPPEDLEKAVKHSMVVIDAEKHKLNYKQSEMDNEIAKLKEIYQGKATGGASTLISKASSEKTVLERKYDYKPDPETGKLTYTETGRVYKDKNGKEVFATQKTTWMADTDDARTLSSGYEQEEAYASYANKLKALANQSRVDAMAIKPAPVSQSAKETYKAEVASLKSKLDIALLNAPKERQAQIIANTIITAKKKDNPDLEKDDLKKIRSQAIADARVKVGAKKTLVDISDKEWQAIQSGAISTNQLSLILNNSDLDTVKKLATPKESTNTLSTARQARIKAMDASGLTTSEIAEALGISTSTVSKYIK